MKRFLRFTDTLGTTKKLGVKQLYDTIRDDCRSTVGRNLRQIILICDKERVYEPECKDVLKLPYKMLPSTERWKVIMIEELLRERDFGDTNIGWNQCEVSYCIEELCIS